MSPLEILQRTRELLADEAKWARGSMARNHLGEPVADPLSSAAVQWCVLGALTRVASGYTKERATAVTLLGAAATEPTRAAGLVLPRFNDESDHATLLATLDQAIAHADDAWGR